jgi:hypothetical protein
VQITVQQDFLQNNGAFLFEFPGIQDRVIDHAGQNIQGLRTMALEQLGNIARLLFFL